MTNTGDAGTDPTSPVSHRQARPAPIRFTVSGKAVSKENYRGRSKAAKRARGVVDAWTKIKAYQESVGWSARAALGRTPRRFAGYRVAVTVEMIGQSVDVDNSKAILDGMIGVVFDDDSQKYVKEVRLVDMTNEYIRHTGKTRREVKPFIEVTVVAVERMTP